VTTLLLILALAPALLVLWHDLWLEPDVFALPAPGRLGMRIGSGSPLASSEPVSSDSRFVHKVMGDANGVREFFLQSEVDGGYRRFALDLPGQGGVVVGLVTSPRRIEMEPGKFAQYLAEEAIVGMNLPAAGMIHEQYSKHAKALVRVGHELPQVWSSPLGLFVELVPLQPVFRVGQAAEFQLLRAGAPLTKTSLFLMTAGGNKTAGCTNAQGRASVTLTQPGKACLRGIHMVPGTAGTHFESFWFSLCFEVEA